MFYVVNRPVIHPGTMEEIVSAGTILTQDSILDLSAELGIDEILCHVCYNEHAAETVQGWYRK
jgi:hypothetical protein